MKTFYPFLARILQYFLLLTHCSISTLKRKMDVIALEWCAWFDNVSLCTYLFSQIVGDTRALTKKGSVGWVFTPAATATPGFKRVNK
jgi:hypothetical protein